MSSTSDSCNDGASKSNDDGECELEEKLQNISMADISVCANCGKEGSSDNMNTCNKCKQVKYCNAVCKKVHKKKHKKDCEEYIRLATEKHNEELRIAAEKRDIELFKEPPLQYGDCPICFERLPILETGNRYKSCCGKTICSGCAHAPVYDSQGNEVTEEKCAFCRTPPPASDEEHVERLKVRMEAGDPEAVYAVGCYYEKGMCGFDQDYTNAVELYHRAGDLGYAQANSSIGYAYDVGQGVEVDKEKAKHYYELAAMRGDATARHNLGINEKEAGNTERALKHHMIAVKAGDNDSLSAVKKLYSSGHATKEDYIKALQSYQEYLGEIKSPQRDKAAATYGHCRYY